MNGFVFTFDSIPFVLLLETTKEMMYYSAEQLGCFRSEREAEHSSLLKDVDLYRHGHAPAAHSSGGERGAPLDFHCYSLTQGQT